MERAIKLLQDANKILVACHRRPDADALGSALGFAFIARSLGKDVTVYVPDSLPPNLRFLACADIQKECPDTAFDVTFVMDTAATSLLPAGLPDEAMRGPMVIVDHHTAHDDVGDVVVRDTDACATAEVVMDMAEILGVRPVPPRAATPLYAALVADTGGFRYPSTRARVLRMGAELIDGGAEPWHVAYELFEGWQPSRLRLLGAVLDSLDVSLDGRLALLFVTRKMLEDCDADDDMVEGMVNYGRMLRGVEIAALVWEFETPDGLQTKVSLRSRGDADISVLATQLGGGGHRAAAGSQVTTNLEDTAVKIRQLAHTLLGE